MQLQLSVFVFLTRFTRLGDEFALREGGSLYCKDDHDVLEKSAQSRVAPTIESNNNTNLNNNNHSSELGSMSGMCEMKMIQFSDGKERKKTKQRQYCACVKYTQPTDFDIINSNNRRFFSHQCLLLIGTLNVLIEI